MVWVWLKGLFRNKPKKFYYCDVCYRRFDSPQAYAGHMRGHHARGEIEK